MKLTELMVDTKTAWIEFPGCDGFEIEIANLSRKELLNLSSGANSETFCIEILWIYLITGVKFTKLKYVPGTL